MVSDELEVLSIKIKGSLKAELKKLAEGDKRKLAPFVVIILEECVAAAKKAAAKKK
jgi:hypothetical protein